MRLIWIGVAACVALSSAGLLLYTEAIKPHVTNVDIASGQPRHPITEAMTLAANKSARKVAPGFELKDVQGKTVVLGSANADRPQFVYFALDGCPCSFDAEPLFQDLSKRFKGKIDFVTVTDAKPDHAKQWWHQMSVPYPVVSDSDVEVMKAYGATNSVFSALVSRDGHIVKLWPGYSVAMLKEMNSMMAKEAGVKEKPFDTKYAPVEKSSGCAFFFGPTKEAAPTG